MEGIIVNFRRSIKRTSGNQMIVVVPDYDKAKAEGLIGKKVIYSTGGKADKKIIGEVRALHGRKGAVRVLFETGMPGQAIGNIVVIE